MRFHSPPTIFHSIDFVEQNGEENCIELLPVELLQIFNPSSLLLLKLSLKVGAPVILLRNLYPKEGLYNSTRIVIICIGWYYIKTQILGGRFHGQLQLIPCIKLTSKEGELPFVISRRQFLIRLCFAMTVNKS
jgi:ATP-dependent DNA helicase PIF1